MKKFKSLKKLLRNRRDIIISVLGLFLITTDFLLAETIENNDLITPGINETNNSIVNVENNGLIIGEKDDNLVKNSGNGVTNFKNQTLENQGNVEVNINNTGVIKGGEIFNNDISLEAISNLGNGVSAYSSQNEFAITANINSLNNTGVIFGSSIRETNDVNSFYNYGSGNGIQAYANPSEASFVSSANSASTLENLSNNGAINGKSIDKQLSTASTSELRTTASGNGIVVFGQEANLKNLSNSGSISGKSNTENSSNTRTVTYGNGNGVVNYSLKTGELSALNNTGTIEGILEMKGTGEQKPIYSGNGIASMEKGMLGNIDNSGLIKGKLIIDPTASKISNNSSGNGIAYDFQNSGNLIKNKGAILGSEFAIKGNDGTTSNYGILVGQNITSSGITLNNMGIAIKLDNNLDIVSIENGTNGVIDGKVVINSKLYDKNGYETDTANTARDSYIVSNGNHYTNNIINGAGIVTGALVVKGGTSVTDSIINGYNTAVYLDDLSQLTATDTTFNGGGLKNDVAVIKGSAGDNIASILGRSIINGIVDLGEGFDTLTIGNSVQVNGKLNGGLGEDILNLGELLTTKSISNLNILHDINEFETINTNGNITLFETVNVTGAESITLESGDLVLRVDPTVTVDGKVTGHALYGNNGTLTSNGGNLVVGLNGIGEGTIVSMGGTTITPETNDSWWKDTDHIKTNSLVLDGKLSADGKDINITVLESIPLEPSIPVPPIDPPVEPEPPINPPVDPPINPEPPVVDSFLYEKLNKVYQSIVTAGEIGNLANTTLLEDKTYNESLGGLLTILDQIYANNPYAYSLKSSRDSLKLFEDNMLYLTIKPKKDEIIVQGKAIYTGVKNDTSDSGKNYYGFDTGHRNYKTTTNTVGGLATFEYGLSDNASVGFVFGGNNQDIKFKGSSKIKGNSLYLGTFAKTDIKNFKFMSGVGYQYTSADVDRKVSNKYDSFSTGDKYDINSLNAFVEAKYVYSAEQDWTVEPKVRLSYYYIDQDKVNEGYTPGQIFMKTDAVNSNTADVEVGVDFVKSLYLNNGKLKNILSLGVINTIGDKSKELNGYIVGKKKDGKKFNIQGVELPKTSGKVSYNLELEQTNGMIYTAGVSLEFAKDYNRNVNATVGIGYKF